MAASKSFSVGGVSPNLIGTFASKNFAQTEKSDPSRKYVAYEKIVPNKLNKKFEQKAVEEIMYSIKVNGLYHELAVVYDSEMDNYRLISGEQRYRAIGMLEEKERKEIFPDGIPVHILKMPKNEIDELIEVYEANLIQRNYTPEDRTAYIIDLLDLYQQKQKMGEIDNAIKKIMEKLNLTERQARKYAAANRMIPELKEALIEGKINLTESEKFATFSEDTQKQIYQLIIGQGRIDSSELEALRKAERNNKDLEKKVAQAAKDIEEKEAKINALTEMLEQTKSTEPKNEETPETEIERLKGMLAKADADKKRAQTTLANLQLEIKEQKERGITASKEELKKAADIAKAEDIQSSLYSLLKEAEKIKDVIKKDAQLKAQYEVIAERLTMIVADTK